MAIVLRSLAAAAAAVVLYAVGVERNWFVLRRHRVPCLAPGARPLRVLHLSDLHLRPAQRRKQRWLRSLATVEPDLVVVTGDVLGDPASTPAAIETLRAIPARAARILVLGSNDYYSPRPRLPVGYFKPHRTRTERPELPRNDWEGLVKGLVDAGWVDLSNRSVEIEGVEILGLDDAHIGRADLSIATARARDGLRLAVSHSPDPVPELARLGYDLIVCGHTHGGQVRVPGVGAVVTNSFLPRGMARGLHRIEGAWLHVSAGLGTSMYSPYRFACRPEACLLELVGR